MTAHPKPPKHKRQPSGHTPPEVYEAVMERSGGLCEDCGAKGKVRHHWPMKKMGGTKRVYTEGEVFYLCQECHDRRHGGR